MRRSEWSLYQPSKQVFSKSVEEHQPDCPRYHHSRRSKTIGLQVVLPRLLAKSIQVAFTATSGAGGFAFSPYFGVTCVVDRSKSPAFTLFDDLWVNILTMSNVRCSTKVPRHIMCSYLDVIELSEVNLKTLEEILNPIYANLALQIDSGLASA